MKDLLNEWLSGAGIGQPYSLYLTEFVIALMVVVLAIVANHVAKKRLLKALGYVVRKSKTTWDDVLFERGVFMRLSHLAPALVIYFSAAAFPQLTDWIQRLSICYMGIVAIFVLDSALSALLDIYATFEVSKERPIKGYVQVAKTFIYIIGAVIIFSSLMGRSPWGVLSGIGAMTAILLLIFKDSILALVASIQLASNDMIHVGDWIAMPKYGADGTVTDVSLNTVKVQNWNKTIATIPTYALISDSFINWRGMEECGGRRIKRSLNIDITSIKFCTDEMLKKFERFQLITEYIGSKTAEIEEYNEAHSYNTSELINGRRLTNIGTFRAYIVEYLKQHPKIRQDMTFLVRHLPPTEHGLPIEIYVFSGDQAWANYEGIQADIFDHIMASLPLFELRIFQYPTGQDVKGALGKPGVGEESGI